MLEENFKKDIEERIEKLRAGDARKYFLGHLDFPIYEKKRDELEIEKKIAPIEVVLPDIEKLIRRIKTEVKFIGERTPICAVYILLGRTFGSLRTVLNVSRAGGSIEIMDLARPAQEALVLVILFLEDGAESQLERWFDGEWVKDKEARDAQHVRLNNSLEHTEELPVREMLSHIYNIYSKYTHNTYGALLDGIDVFQQDVDFDRYAGFHYANEQFHIVQDLAVKIVLQLKNVAAYLKDLDMAARADEILKMIGRPSLSPEQVAEVVKQHSKRG